jgi:hypothetical protein
MTKWNGGGVVLLVLDAGWRHGHSLQDLLDFADEKLEINKRRKWGKMDKNGVCKHIKQQMKTNFYIKHFDDYHEIRDNEYKSVELGCFPPKRGNYGYFRYFGLFYKGKRPSFETVFPEIKKLVYTGSFIHYRTSEDITVTEKDLKRELKKVLR